MRVRFTIYFPRMDGWMDDLQFYGLSTVFKSYQDDGEYDNKRLSAMEPIYS